MVNAFWLDRDLERAVAWLVDAHVTSSVFECAMVLTTAVQLNGYPREDSLYFTHADNPLTRWATESYGNWQRLRAYTEAAHEEWRYRWDHDADESHGSWGVVETLDGEAVADLSWPADSAGNGSNDRWSGGWSDPPQLTGEWSAPDHVDAYRYYYANDKRDLFEWAKDRTEPSWIEAYTVEADERPSGSAVE